MTRRVTNHPGQGTPCSRRSRAGLYNVAELLRRITRPDRDEGIPVRYVVYGLAVLLGFFGLVELIAAGQGNTVVRVIVGVVCLAAAGALVVLVRLKPIQTTHTQHVKLDLSGDVSLEKIQCRQCGAELSSKSVRVAAGAVFVTCEYCGAEYQLEEAPKW